MKYAILFLAFAVSLPCAQGTVIYSDSLQNGEDSSWTITSGKWSWSIDGLSNSATGENRIFLDALKGIDIDEGYEIHFKCNLKKGSGWGVFFNAGLNSKNQVSGYSFQYDPGYSSGAYLLRKWTNNSETVVTSAIHKEMQNYNTNHDFVVKVSSSAFSVMQDGVDVLSYGKSLNSFGELVGLRTWSCSSAMFSDFSISDTGSVPEPATLSLMLGCIACCSKRFQGR